MINYYFQFYVVSNFDSLNSAFAEVVPITPGVESFRDCWTQHLVWRGFSSPSDFQSVVDCWSRRQWERTKTYNSIFNTSCSTVKPYPQIILDSVESAGYPPFGHETGSLNIQHVDNLKHIMLSNSFKFFHSLSMSRLSIFRRK
jgi:hypothetical protein